MPSKSQFQHRRLMITEYNIPVVEDENGLVFA